MTTTADPKWSDDSFLDRLRQSTDDLANATVAELQLDGSLTLTNRILAALRTGGEPLPDDAPEPFVRFVDVYAAETRALDFDRQRAARGAEVFRRWAYPACVVMLASSLPNGYAAPCLSRILTISDDLAVHPYRRLLGVLQLLVNVSCPGDDDHEDAQTSALKLRLLHGGVRALVPEQRPDFIERYGLPVNHEDMLATIMGFSLLVVDGIRTLGLDLADDDAEDFYYLWSIFSHRMGIAPSADPKSSELIPQTLADAEAFYTSYRRRHFCDNADDNPDGVLLTQRNRQMMIDLIPRSLRWLGLGRAPDIAMTELLGQAGMARVGLQPTAGHHVDKMIFHFLLGFGQKAEGLAEDFYTRFSMTILQDLIDHGMGTVTFSVPGSVEALRRLVVPNRQDSA